MEFFDNNQQLEEIDVEQERQNQLTEIGTHFQQIRLAKELDLEIISHKIHIPISLLNAIENANLSKLPEPIFIKQLLKKYAEFLQITDEKVKNEIDDFNTTKIQSKSQKINLTNYWPFRGINFNSKSLYILYGILLLFSIRSLSSFLQPSQLITNKSLNQLDVIETNNSNSSNKPELVKAVETKNKSSSIAQQLVLKVTIEEECWVRVTADGKKIYEGTLNKGDKQEWIAKENLTIRAGNAGGLIFSLNDGQPQKLGKLWQVEEINFELPKQS